jgi:hypothetical protein
LNQVRGKDNLLAALKGLGKDSFRSRVETWREHIKLREEDRWKPATLRYEYEEDKLKSRVQY